jgi:hypothetical protein
MISQIDIDDWKDEDYLNIFDEIPEESKKIKIVEENDDIVLDFKDFVVAYGKALHQHLRVEFSKK